MKKFSLTACACAALVAGSASAQSLRDTPVPAEFPPSSYAGAQYVDSQGCVFVRAGVAGNVTWVPRMTRSREPLCGFKPSFTAQAAPAPTEPAATPTPQATVAAAPVVVATPPAPRTTPAPAPAPRTVAVRNAAPAPKPEPTAIPSAAPPPAPKAAASVQTRQARVITPPDPSRTACFDATGVSAAYMVQHNGSPVRCGPQSTPHVTYVRNTSRRSAAPRPGTPVARGNAPAGTRVALARVYAEQQKGLAGIRVPEGMQPVWEDDRLNPRRTHQTFEGMAQMEVMWTNTVPRRLIDRQTGADIIHKYPGLQPPYTSFEQQRAAGVYVATRGRITPEPQTVRRTARAAPAATPEPTQPVATVSTRSTPDAPQPANHRYAQAGIFADATQGKAAAQKIARAGLPARRGTLTRDGRALTLVLAGPFASQTQLERGVARLHGLGFADVRLRK